MIVDRALYESTSCGSAARILCRCDTCGVERAIAKQKLVQRGDNYERCRDCYYVRNGSMSRAYIESQCIDCGKTENRRADALKVWSGRCSSCSSKETASRPEMKAMKVEIGKRHAHNLKAARKNVVNYRRGPAHSKWKGGITPENMRVRASPETRQWRNNVFARDDYTCQCCGARGGNLEVDHIMPFALYPELRHQVFNGRTLCRPCHRLYGAKVTNGRQVKEPVFPHSGGLAND